MSTPVCLTRSQAEYAERVALARHEANARVGRHIQTLGSRISPLEIQLRGAYAEVVVAVAEGLWLRCPVVESESLARALGPDVGPWQVKYSGYTPPILMVPVHQHWKRTRDPLLLVGGERPYKLYIAGWCPAGVLFDEVNIRPIYRRFDAFVAPQLYEWRPGLWKEPSWIAMSSLGCSGEARVRAR